MKKALFVWPSEARRNQVNATAPEGVAQPPRLCSIAFFQPREDQQLSESLSLLKTTP